MGRFLGITVKTYRVAKCPTVHAWTGASKNLTQCLCRWEPDLRSKFFFSPLAHLCAVTYYITEISLHVTLLTNQSRSLTHRLAWKKKDNSSCLVRTFRKDNFSDLTTWPALLMNNGVLRTVLGRSVWATIATQHVWLNRFTGSQPSH